MLLTHAYGLLNLSEMHAGEKEKRKERSKSLYLHNLLIRHASHEEVLFVLVWVELDAVRHLPVGEPRDALACGGQAN